MNQSAVRFLCSCVVLAAVTAQAHAGTDVSSPALQARRELAFSIRQRGNEAHKLVQQESIKIVMSKAVLLAQLQASLNLQPALASAETVAQEPNFKPSAD